LNIGNFLLGATALEIGAALMEGLEVKALDEECGLREKGCKAVVIVDLGCRAEDDFIAKSPISRLPHEQIISMV